MDHIYIDKQYYKKNKDEFKPINHDSYTSLKLYTDISLFERLNGLITEIYSICKLHMIIYNPTHGGFLAISLSKVFNKIFLSNVTENHIENISNNISHHKTENIYFEENIVNHDKIIFSNEFIDCDSPLIICLTRNDNSKHRYKYVLDDEKDIYIYISDDNINKDFMDKFKYCIREDVNFNKLHFDNLLQLAMIVKNGGNTFTQLLNNLYPYIDRWTILDTGSTDDTIETINKVLCNKPGKLYQEPFINFRESRNRCLDLAGNSCKFIIMLDDTYTLNGDLRKFLKEVRSDQFADSYSLNILSNDVEYSSNRIINANRNLRYIYRIHEIIQSKDNINVGIPRSVSNIIDLQSELMTERTHNRKEYDYNILLSEINDEPHEPRHLYYMGQTLRMLNRSQEAYEYYMKRVNHPNRGYLQEVYDSYFESARICNFSLQKPWEECLQLYLKAYETDPERPESFYFIGIHYLQKNENKQAYEYFKKSFSIGYPNETKMSMKPTLSYRFLPLYLTPLCYEFEDYETGFNCTQLFLDKNDLQTADHKVMKSWNSIFICLRYLSPSKQKSVSDKPIFTFVVDGGFKSWSGKDIENNGLGGSETCIVELARHIQATDKFKVIVFCRCDDYEVHKDVLYAPFKEFLSFFNYYDIDYCIVSRYSEYIPYALKSGVKNVYAMSHDINFTGNVIPVEDNFKGVICLTEWHKNLFIQEFPSLENYTKVLGYGIDTELFKPKNKIPYKFIYSSFPNRGLLPLLEMWPNIIDRYPSASLHIYCDYENEWVNKYHGQQLSRIKELLKNIGYMNIYNHGWVDKKTLAESWSTSHVWFYPCIFNETFCLTAFKAAASKTLVVTNDLAALKDTVGDRGLVIPGNPVDNHWKLEALNKMFYVLDNKHILEEYTKKNYYYVLTKTWFNQTQILLQILNITKKININNDESFIEFLNNPLKYDIIYIDKKSTFCELYTLWTMMKKNSEMSCESCTEYLDLIQKLPEKNRKMYLRINRINIIKT